MSPNQPPAPRWRLRLLGGFALDDGQRRLTRLHSRAAVALLARLALAPQRDHGRDELAALLWPEADLATGRARLRSTLSTLKALLDDPVQGPAIEADRRVLRLAAGVIDSDVAALLRAAARHDAEGVQAAYGGELLPGLADEWIHDERLVLAALAERWSSATREPRTASPAPASQPAGVGAPPEARPASQPIPGLATGPASGAIALDAGLPHPLGRSFGQDDLVRQAVERVLLHRLVTVTGPGGGGKTRLAVAVARRLASAVPPAALQAPDFDTVRFVPLVSCREAGQVADALALALGLQGSGELEELLVGRLQGRRVLLVADNTEQLDDRALALLARLVERLPQLHCLATSRRPLGLAGEQLLVVQPLAPADAMALYEDRAAASRPDFRVHAGNAGAVAELVRLLHGLPLALELAAARVRTLPPPQLLSMLQEAPSDPQARDARWQLLERRGPRAGTDPRQASMRAVVDGSLALLAPQGLALLHLLAEPLGALPLPVVLDAAAAHDLGPHEVAAELDDLVAASLIGPAAFPGGTPAFQLTEPVRDRLRQRGAPAAGAARAARAAWRHAIGRWAAGLPPTIPLDELEAMLPLLVWVTSTLAEDGQPDWFLALMLDLAPGWAERAAPQQMRQALSTALGGSTIEAELRSRGHALAAQLALAAGAREEALDHAQQAARAWPAAAAARAMARVQVARVRWRGAGDVAGAQALLDQAEADAPGDPALRGAVLTLRATLANEIDRDPQRAQALYAQALVELEVAAASGGNAHVWRGLRYNLAITEVYAGRAAQALPLLRDLRAEALAAHDRQLAVQALNAEGSALDLLGRTQDALAVTAASAGEAWSLLDTEATLYALWNVAPLALAVGRAEPAARLMGFADGHWRTRFGALSPSDRRDVARIRRGCRQALGRLAAERAWRAGAALPLARAVAEAIALGWAGGPARPRPG